MLCYYFPPLGMGGTQRAAKFAKYLPEFGWQPTVLTVKPLSYWAEDPTLLDELGDTRVIRTESLDPQRLIARIRGQAGAHKISTVATRKDSAILRLVNETIVPFFLVPDSKILWRPHAIRAASRLLEEEKFDAIFTTSPPHSVHLIGQALAKKHGLRWVADFRDEWSGGVVVHEPTWVQRRLNLRLQQRVLRAASAVICVTKGIQASLSGTVNASDRFHLIENGFDEADFPARTVPAVRQPFTFCHCGSITKFSNPASLLKALSRIKRQDSNIANKIHFQFVGHDVLGNLVEDVRRLELGDMVDLIGYKSHQEALQYLVNADALLLVAKGNPGACFIPGKTFEYIGAGKPILALTNVKDTIDLLREVGIASINEPDDIEGIADTVMQIAGSAVQSAQIERAQLQQYTRKHQTKRLASVLEGGEQNI